MGCAGNQSYQYKFQRGNYLRNTGVLVAMEVTVVLVVHRVLGVLENRLGKE